MINGYNEMITEKSELYKDILLDAKVCPTCFSTIDDKIANNIVKELNK